MPTIKFEVVFEYDVTEQDGAEDSESPTKDEIAEAVITAIRDGLEQLEGEEVGDQYELTDTSFDVHEK